MEVLERGKKDNGITALYQHGDYLWIGSSRADIECYDLKRKAFITINTGNGQPLSDTYVTDIVCVGENTYYVSTWNGLYRLKLSSKDLSSMAGELECIEQTYPFRTEKKITSLLWNDSRKMLWMGTFGSGALKVDFTEDTCTRLREHIYRLLPEGTGNFLLWGY